jgi:uncharacterized protein (TIGR03083 family)
MSTDKAATGRELRESWDAIKSLVDSLPEREMTEVPVVEGWTVKDLLGHMAFWAEKAAEDLKLAAADRFAEIETPGGDEQVDVWNARESERRKNLSLAQVREEWVRSYEAAAAAFDAVPADKLDIDVKGWTMGHRFAEDTYRHYDEHAEQIRAWQRQLETTEA